MMSNKKTLTTKGNPSNWHILMPMNRKMQECMKTTQVIRPTRTRKESEQFMAKPAAWNSESGAFTQMRVVFLQAVSQY